MIDLNSPWTNMPESSQRRIPSEKGHNIFWITDLQGNYGFCIALSSPFKQLEAPIKLKGIQILKRNSQKNTGDFILVLKNKEDWQIFYTLCTDLSTDADKHDSEKKMMSSIEQRLKKWHRLLKLDLANELSKERQMGLFSELSLLKDIIEPKFGIQEAIVSWVGPDFDRQDFLLKNSVIEVKSYRTSKGPTVNISSLGQLCCGKEPLYLASYGLTETDAGKTVEHIINDINKLLEDKPSELAGVFSNKLLEYGYIPEIIKKPLYKFKIDQRLVYSVSDEFPKLLRDKVDSRIISVKYSIDLEQCSEFKIDVKSIFN